jgi:nucleoside-triphosphatase THEP1
VGIDIIDLATHERRRLASSRTPDSRGVLTDDWCLDADTLEWVNQILRGIGDSSLVILDELGPLEFTRGLGLMDGLHLIDRRSSGAAFVVVRPRLLERARARWPDSGIIDIAGGRPPVESVLGDIIASRT